MIGFVILFTYTLSNAQSLEQYCYAMGVDCDYEILCLWNGTDCDIDENAEVSFNPIDTTGRSGVSTGSTPYYDGTTTTTVYFTYSSVKDVNAIDKCSLDYFISTDLYSASYCDTTQCGLINYGVDSAGHQIDACVDFCWANPTSPSCLSPPCYSGMGIGIVCCAAINSISCQDYCTVNGTSEICCGGPPVFDTVNTPACGNYAARFPTSTTNNLRERCLLQPTNLSACGLCSTYYTCCARYRNKTGSAAICDYFCTIDKPADADCVIRKSCMQSLGHEPSEAELQNCLSSVGAKSCASIIVEEICPLAEGCIWDGSCKKKDDPTTACPGLGSCDSCFDYKLAGSGLSCDTSSCVVSQIKDYDVCASQAVVGKTGCANVRNKDCAGFSDCYSESGVCIKDACVGKSDAECTGECSVKSLGGDNSECINTAKHTITDNCVYYSNNTGSVGLCEYGEKCTAKEVALIDGTKGTVCEGASGAARTSISIVFIGVLFFSFL